MQTAALVRCSRGALYTIRFLVCDDDEHLGSSTPREAGERESADEIYMDVSFHQDLLRGSVREAEEVRQETLNETRTLKAVEATKDCF